MSQSSYVSDAGINVLIINVSETEYDIIVKTGIYYAGVIAGSCCADDPSPMSELNEYCEAVFKINKITVNVWPTAPMLVIKATNTREPLN